MWVNRVYEVELHEVYQVAIWLPFLVASKNASSNAERGASEQRFDRLIRQVALRLPRSVCGGLLPGQSM